MIDVPVFSVHPGKWIARAAKVRDAGTTGKLAADAAVTAKSTVRSARARAKLAVRGGGAAGRTEVLPASSLNPAALRLPERARR